MKALTLLIPCASEFGKVEVTSTPAGVAFLGPLHCLNCKLDFSMTYSYINSEFRHTSKNFEGELPKHILWKNTVF